MGPSVPSPTGTTSTIGPILVKVTFSDEELAALDSHRGNEPRASCIRRLTLDAVANEGVTVSGTRPQAQEPRELTVVDGAPRRGRLTLSEELQADPGVPLPPKVPVRR